MKHLIPLLVLAACASTSGMSPEQKKALHRGYVAEARVYVEESRVIADSLVAAGKIKQAEVDVAYAALESAVAVLEAAIDRDDPEALGRARARLVGSIARVAVLIATADDAPEEPRAPAENS